MYKILLFTDIHHGKKNNSIEHNEDCSNFIDWVISIAKEQQVDSIGFLGDWNESRSSIDLVTLKYSYKNMEKLNKLGIPIYFVVGNHDMANRNERDTISTIYANSFENFVVIDKPTSIEVEDQKWLFCPYLNESEYPILKQYTDHSVWLGHFEFKGFILTGANVVATHGADPNEYVTDLILSGHYHKRQNKKHVHFIGNTFPMDFGDANDFERGCCILDSDKQLTFYNWDQGPKYVVSKLSEFAQNPSNYKNVIQNSHCKIIVDVDITYEKLGSVEQLLLTKYKPRTLLIDDSILTPLVYEEDQRNEDIDTLTKTTEQIISEMLEQIKLENVDKELLLNLFRSTINNE
jgi:DNA repair exonuclease SbcCD nuclease subunit